MTYSVLEMPRYVRRQLKRTVHKSADPQHSRRALAILQLWESAGNVTEVARRLCAARSSVHKWRALYEQFGQAGLEPQVRGRQDAKANDKLLKVLEKLCEGSPQQYGYLRSRWSSGLLAEVLFERTGVDVHATTICRWLARLRFVFRRARPTLHIRDPRKSQRMRAVNQALREAESQPGTEVFYTDEADIDLNPRIGPTWTRRGCQHTVPTPGKNHKRYLAGALHARTGRVVWAEDNRKDSFLFIRLLHRLKRTYRKAKRIVLIADNYVIHKSAVTRRWLHNNPKFELVFQPAYCPWVNVIERLWKALHDTVTRNHKHSTMNKLMRDVRRFLQICQPFPGANQALALA